VSQQANGAVAVPELERGSLVLALTVGRLHFEHYLFAVHGDGGRDKLGDDAAGERLAEGQAPPLRYRTAVGQRYASACLFFSDGSFSRISTSRERSSSATITVSSSGACASTSPQGSTINERP
jgi:hypothetical protein